MKLRQYQTSDCRQLAELFYQTVHSINRKDYSQPQLNAWADGRIDLIEWDKSFKQNYTIIATENNNIVGFGDITAAGYLNRLFVHKDYQRQKIASAICDELEKAVQVTKLTTHSSITAKPFFLQRGYKVIQSQTVLRNGISLTNYLMEKRRTKE
ncbi:MAG: GNAT family N-acetyltransferase [Erysipelotrichaceae bacterium]